MALHEHWFRVGNNYAHPLGWTIVAQDYRDFRNGGTYLFVEPFNVVDPEGNDLATEEGPENAAAVAERLIVRRGTNRRDFPELRVIEGGAA